MFFRFLYHHLFSSFILLLLCIPNTVSAAPLTAQERIDIAAKLIPIYMIILQDDIKNPVQTPSVGSPYTKTISSYVANATFILSNPPEGMTIHPTTGVISWTPTPNQVGKHTITVSINGTIQTYDISVSKGVIDTNNTVFISSHGNNTTGDGSYAKPYVDTKKVCTDTLVGHPDLVVYYRGGEYTNAQFGSGGLNNKSMPRINCSGTAGHRVNVKPWGNEKVKFKFDSALAIRLSGNYINFQGMEIEGIAQQITYKEAITNWWKGDRYYNGSGLVIDGHHVEVSDTIVHDTPASGISGKGGDFITIRDNIVYNCDWWTIAGSKGIGVTDAVSFDANTTAAHIKIVNNLIFNVESRIISRVWSKGYAHLTIDEGEGILVQINNGTYTGRYLIKNNFLLYTGKGIVVNKTNKADLISNTLYQTGTTMSGNFKGLRGNTTNDTNLSNNAVSIYPVGYAYSMANSTNLTQNNNCFEGNDTIRTIAGAYFSQGIFTNPDLLDFSIKDPHCAGTGADLQIWQQLKAKADTYAINIAPTGWTPNYTTITRDIIDNIPVGSSIDFSSWDNLNAFDLNITNIPAGVTGRPSNFTLQVVHPYNRIDLAYTYGKARQGSVRYSGWTADKAIDNNNTTHAYASAGSNNWWEVELPPLTEVSKIIIQNTYNLTLGGANVYLGTTPYNGTVNTQDLVGTLNANNLEQILNFPVAKAKRYLLIKGAGSNKLALTKVEMYGRVSQAPVVNQTNVQLLIPIASQIGQQVLNISAIDYQNDNIKYKILENVPFSIDAWGNITVNGTLTGSNYTFTVEVSDGFHVTRVTISIDITSINAITDALSSGRVNSVTTIELLNAIRAELQTIKTGEPLQQALYNSESIQYDPTNRSQFIRINDDIHTVYPIIMGNKGNVLAAAGTKVNSRFAAFGAAPTEAFSVGNNLGYAPQFKRLLAWLMAGLPLNATALDVNKTIAISFTKADTNNIKNWFATNYPNITLKDCNTVATLSSCYTGVDMIITGWQANAADAPAIRQVLDGVVQTGTPLLYLHTWYEANNAVGDTIANLLGFTLPYGGNYWAKDKAVWNSITDMQTAFYNSFKYDSIDVMMAHFQAQDYLFDWTLCTGSNNDDCSLVPLLSGDFEQGATKVRDILTSLDKTKKDIFLGNKYKLQKLLALLGDKFRQSVLYPMDKITTDDNQFMQSMYADHAVYNYRSVNPVQPDMGNFSRSDFSTIVPVTKTIVQTSKKYFRSTGLYALPGQTVRATRNDISNLTVKVFVNTLRSGATHQYQKDGYNRPKYLQSAYMQIDSGQSIYFTSPYGGPIELSYSVNDLNVSVTFQNVGEHPYWASAADDVTFSQRLQANQYDWAEVATSGFEVHSTLSKMQKSISDPNWGSAQVLANAIQTYTSNYPHVLAGFRGPGITVIPEIHDYATINGLAIDNIDLVKHMNADQAACGYGCSGNPYDAYWAFDPVGHGDIHELGHGLEKSLFLFSGWELHSTTNPYSYYTKSMFIQNGGNTSCQDLPFKEVFTKLQLSVNDANATAYLQTNLWATSSWSHQFMVILQAMMHTQQMGKLQNGWHLLARLHILERELKRAKLDWPVKKFSIGFDTYSLTEINAINSNDWMLVSMSYAAGLDFRDYLTMMGITYSAKAAAQVASFSYPVVPRTFFVSTSNGYCTVDSYGSYLNKSTLPINGLSTFPY